MMDDLPTDYDTIVVGTGMPECILAAAHSRNGRHVLHIDRNEYYGGSWSSFSFTALESWLEEAINRKETPLTDWDSENFQPFLKEGESSVPCHYRTDAFTDFSIQLNVPEKIEIEKVEQEENSPDNNDPDKLANDQDQGAAKEIEPAEELWTLAKMKSLYRKFNLDLAPKLLFSRGELVDLLISSNIARYAEFKAVTRVLTYLDDKLELVPCSRADVFSTQNVSVVEKRMLMKLLTFCMNYEQNSKEYEGYEEKTFLEFLKSRKLTENLLHYVVHAIAMVTEDASTLEGLEATRRFLNSLGRFGNTPFLWPLYGSGELPQCFCRLCAVYGGIYYLKRGVEAVILNSDGLCTGIISGGKRMNCKWLVMETNYAPTTFLPKDRAQKRVSKAIVITDKSLLPAEKEQITFLRLPKGDQIPSTVSVMELGSGAMVCPPGLFVVYLSVQSVGSAANDLKPAMEVLFGTRDAVSEKPNVMWSLFFSQHDSFDGDLTSANRPENVILTSTPSSAVDFDDTVKQARAAFKSAFPEEEFLPRAPDPEEIIIEGAVEDAEPAGFQEVITDVQEVVTDVQEDVTDVQEDVTDVQEVVTDVEESDVVTVTHPAGSEDVAEDAKSRGDRSPIPEIFVSSPEKRKDECGDLAETTCDQQVSDN